MKNLGRNLCGAIALLLVLGVLGGCSKVKQKNDLDLAREYAQAKDQDNVRKHLDKYTAEFKDDPLALYSAMLVYSRKGYQKEQIQTATQLLNLLDKQQDKRGTDKNMFAEMYSTVALYMDKADKPLLAQRGYEQALKMLPEDPMFHNNLAYYYAEQNIKLEEAYRLVDIAIRAKPGDPSILDTLGWVLYKQTKYAEAEHYLKQAVELQPNQPDLRYHLAAVYAAVNKKNEALIEVKKALALAPDHKEALQLQKRLGKIL